MSKIKHKANYFPYIENPHYSLNIINKTIEKKENEISTLPREVLKWIQCLDLTYPIKNIKKDFLNGFLIAQIYNRYFPNLFPMHTFDNGLNSSAKSNNWSLIEKYKKTIPDTVTVNNPRFWKMTNMVRYANESASEILKYLNDLFQELTKRKLDLENKIYTDVDNVNKSFILNQQGEPEDKKKDHEHAESQIQDVNIQKSITSKFMFII